MMAEEKTEKKKNNIMLFILATNIVASRPPKCRSKIQNTRLGLQCQTPRRSYPLSLIPFPLSLIPFHLTLNQIDASLLILEGKSLSVGIIH